MSQMLVVEELWRIYTFYTLHGDPLDPEHLRSTQLIKMLSKDCGLVTRGGDLLEADIFNAFQAEVTRSDKIAPGDARPHSALKMSLGGALAKVHTDRTKVRPRAAGGVAPGWGGAPPPPPLLRLLVGSPLHAHSAPSRAPTPPPAPPLCATRPPDEL